MFSDDAWDVRDAKGVCRPRGFSDEGADATYGSNYGKVSTNFIMDDVACDGTESHIGLCPHLGTHNCGSHEGAGVICKPSTGELKEYSFIK